MYVPLNEIMSSIYIKLYLYKIWNKKQPLNYHMLSHKYELTYIMNEPLNKVIRLHTAHSLRFWLALHAVLYIKSMTRRPVQDKSHDFSPVTDTVSCSRS